jgi:hypothetical protein
MLEALIGGKLSREQENMEDVLTSAVFGNLRYAPPSKGLYRFIAHARLFNAPDESAFPLRKLLADGFLRCDDAKTRFWPRWTTRGGRRCEPDVVVHCRSDDGASLMIAIEAKYRSGKSSEAQDDEADTTDFDLRDQLAIEWHCLSEEAAKIAATPYLIYLTADVGIPRAELLDSLAEFARRYPQEPTPQLLSLSWRVLSQEFANAEVPALRDVGLLARRLNLVYFSGFVPAAEIVPFRWRFNTLPHRWFGASANAPISWSFQNGR